MLGPRIGKFDRDGTPQTLLGHNIPMAMFGTFILLFGWFGFNAASIGVLAGLIVIEVVWFVERRLKIDDPVGAIAVHGACGLQDRPWARLTSTTGCPSP